MTNDLCLTIYKRPPGSPGGMRELACTYFLHHSDEHSWQMIQDSDRHDVIAALVAIDGRANDVSRVLSDNWTKTLMIHYGNTDALNDLRVDLLRVTASVLGWA